jgi:hypothetical protein
MVARLVAAGVAILVLFAVLNVPWRCVVHSIDIPGHPGNPVEFMQERTLLGWRGDYFVRFANGSEPKAPIVPGDVSLDELRRDSWVEYTGGTLTVHGPRGAWISVAGYPF